MSGGGMESGGFFVDNPLESGFTRVPNEAVRDARLSFRARGLLTWILSHEHGFRIDSDSVSQASTEGRDAVRTAFRELIAAGYVRREKSQNSRGQWVTATFVSARPATGFQSSGEPASVFQALSEKTSEKKVDPPVSPPRSPVSAKYRGDVQRVFEAWRGSLPEDSRGRVVLTADRERKCVARLREGYAVDVLCEAVVGWVRSAWHVERRQWDMALILRDGAHVDRFVDFHRHGDASPVARAGSGGAADALAARLAAAAGASAVGGLFKSSGVGVVESKSEGALLGVGGGFVDVEVIDGE